MTLLMSTLYLVYDEIKFPLSKVSKTCIEEAIFPESLKIAKVTPVFKNVDSTNQKNYRAIFILPVRITIL